MSLCRRSSLIVATLVMAATLCASFLPGQVIVLHHHGHGHHESHAVQTEVALVLPHDHGHDHVFSIGADETRVERRAQTSQIAKPQRHWLVSVIHPLAAQDSLGVLLARKLPHCPNPLGWADATVPLIGTVGLRI